MEKVRVNKYKQTQRDLQKVKCKQTQKDMEKVRGNKCKLTQRDIQKVKCK